MPYVVQLLPVAAARILRQYRNDGNGDFLQTVGRNHDQNMALASDIAVLAGELPSASCPRIVDLHRRDAAGLRDPRR